MRPFAIFILLALISPAVAERVHLNEERGFQITIPDGWSVVPHRSADLNVKKKNVQFQVYLYHTRQGLVKAEKYYQDAFAEEGLRVDYDETTREGRARIRNVLWLGSTMGVQADFQSSGDLGVILIYSFDGSSPKSVVTEAQEMKATFELLNPSEHEEPLDF